jgi:hypothetical protein
MPLRPFVDRDSGQYRDLRERQIHITYCLSASSAPQRISSDVNAVSSKALSVFVMGFCAQTGENFKPPVFYRHFEHPSRDFVHVMGNMTEFG